MGEQPYWYRLIVAARYLHVPPWELAQQPTWWMETAMIARNAEIEAENERNRKR